VKFAPRLPIFEIQYMLANKNSPNVELRLAYFFNLILLALVVYRACILQITNDEAYSFMLADTVLQKDLSRRLMVGTANTHWLNTLALFIETKLIGHSMLALKLHSVIAFAFFSYAIIKIARLSGNFLSSFIVYFALIVCNTYMLDFFSLCRGYGLALAFQAWAIYYFLSNKEKHTLRISVLFGLSIWANFSFILLPICVLAYEFIIACRNFKAKVPQFFKQWAILTLCILLAFPCLYYIKYVTGDLEEGQSNGLIIDTFGVFIARSYYFISTAKRLYACIGICSLLIIVRAVFFYKQTSSYLKAFWLIFLLYLGFILFLFYVLHSPFPYGRTALCVCFPALIILCEAISTLLQNFVPRLQVIGASIMLMAVVTYAVKTKNFNTTYEWWMQQGLQQCFDKLYALEGNNISKIKLGMSIDHYGSFMNYYDYLNPQKCAKQAFNYYRDPYDKLPPSTGAALQQQEYLMMLGDYKSYLDKLIPPEKRLVIEHYPDMQTDLIKILK
jgi:hypothetical protein